MGMNKSDILAMCIMDEVCQLPEEKHQRIAKMVEELSLLADPQSDLLRQYERALQKVINDSRIGVVPRSHLDHIERLLNE